MTAKFKHPFAVALLLVLGATLSSGANAMKCWENDEGVTECGDAVPPEYAQKGHVEKSASGVTVNKQERAKTEEELAQEATDADALAAQQAEEERIKKEQAARDRVLLATYMVEEDLTMARDGRLAAIDSRVKHAEVSTTKLEGRLEELQAEAAKLERDGKEIPAELLGDIKKVQNQLGSSLEYMAAREVEKQQLMDKFESDLARFRELKGTQ